MKFFKNERNQLKIFTALLAGVFVVAIADIILNWGKDSAMLTYTSMLIALGAVIVIAMNFYVLKINK